ncbi:MAG: FSR family fosmidomycin resistance protein-like MFS transporter [Pseudohongiellaceae bacterium]|jgi:FSR family fosmidomycin resistance protein-like MFS transporter
MENINDVDKQLESETKAKTNRFLLTAFPLGHLVNDWPGAALWLLAPAIAVSMGLGPLEVGLLITIHSAGAALAYLPAGLLGDYFRDRGILLTITFWWVAIGYFLAASVSNFWLLALALGVAGLADAAWHPIATGVMVEQMPKQRAKVLGLHALGGTLAEVGAPVTAGFLLAFFDWQTVLQISTIPAFIMAFVFLRYRHRVPQSKESSLTRGDIGTMIKVWIQPGNIRIVGIIVFYNMALMGALAMLPLYMQTIHDLPLAKSGLIFAAIWSIGAIAQPLLGHFSDVTGRKFTIVFGLLFSTVFLILAVLTSHLMAFIVLIVLAVAALAGIRAVMLATMLDVAGKRETTTLGLAFAMMDGVGALGALLAGLVAQYELHYAFVFAAIVAFIAVVLTISHPFVGRDQATQPPS